MDSDGLQPSVISLEPGPSASDRRPPQFPSQPVWTLSPDPGLNLTSVFPSGLAADGKAEGTGARQSRHARRRRCAAWVASRRIVLTTPPCLRDRLRQASVPARRWGKLA